MSIDDLVGLFNKRPSHTRNFADKLFQFDKYSAIATAGSAYINGKEIKDIIRLISLKMQADEAAYEMKDIDSVLNEFCQEIKEYVLGHLKKSNLTETDFVFSHFNRTKDIPQVFVIQIKASDKDTFDPADPNLVTYTDRSKLKVITDGQDTYVDRLLFGSLYTNITDLKESFLNYIIKACKLRKVKKQEIIDTISKDEFLHDIVFEDFTSIRLRELSLQEAVNLAALLIKIIMDIQVYTERVPTVGGLIRLAVISKDEGFQWISGDKIIPSSII